MKKKKTFKKINTVRGELVILNAKPLVPSKIYKNRCYIT